MSKCHIVGYLSIVYIFILNDTNDANNDDLYHSASSEISLMYIVKCLKSNLLVLTAYLQFCFN